jgi:hypothetical protein
MKYYITLLLLGFSFLSQSQTKIKFSYDNAGNQVSRILCINCPSESAKEIKEIEALTDEDLEKFSENEMISYYPNPVKEELYLKWELTENNNITSIQVFSITGQILNTYQVANNNAQNILFQSHPSGVYLVLLNYKSGDQKTIKIIKQ